MRVQLQRYGQIFRRILSRVVARTRLSDIADVSSFKQLTAAVSRELEEAYYQLAGIQDTFDIDTASGQDLDDRAAELPPDGPTRLGARRSVGSLQFSRSGTAGAAFIPRGTAAKRADGVTYETTVAAFILDGSSVSTAVPSVATDAGSDGDTAAGTVTILVSSVAGVTGVTNITSFANGRLQESDESFRDRIKTFTRSLAAGIPDSFQNALIGLEDPATGKEIVSVSVVKDPIARGNATVYVDDGTGTIEETEAVSGEVVTSGLLGPPADSAVGGEEFLDLDNTAVKSLTSVVSSGSGARGTLVADQDYFFNPATGRLFFSPALTTGEVITATYVRFTGLIAEAYKVLYGDPSDRLNFPGKVSAGDRVLVAAPTPRDITVAGILTVADGFDRDELAASIESAIITFINGLGTGQDVVFNRLVEVIMGFGGVEDIRLTLPSANVPILDNERARTSTLLVDID